MNDAEVPARRHHPRGVLRTPAPRSPSSPPRTSCARLLGQWLQGGICFSAEKADQVTLAENGIDDVLELVGMPLPSVYSAELSRIRVRRRREAAARRDRPDLMYLSTTDYVQHKHAPGTPAANALLRDVRPLPRAARRARRAIALTADHGMNAKTDADGAPECLSAGPVRRRARRRHGARDPADHRPLRRPPRRARLVRHGLPAGGADARRPSRSAARRCRASSSVLTRAEAAARFELPPDRIGDLVVCRRAPHRARHHAARHDLSGLDAPLRSHGGVSEQRCR